jgi:hypothetical protein
MRWLEITEWTQGNRSSIDEIYGADRYVRRVHGRGGESIGIAALGKAAVHRR